MTRREALFAVGGAVAATLVIGLFTVVVVFPVQAVGVGTVAYALVHTVSESARWWRELDR